MGPCDPLAPLPEPSSPSSPDVRIEISESFTLTQKVEILKSSLSSDSIENICLAFHILANANMKQTGEAIWTSLDIDFLMDLNSTVTTLAAQARVRIDQLKRESIKKETGEKDRKKINEAIKYRSGKEQVKEVKRLKLASHAKALKSFISLIDKGIKQEDVIALIKSQNLGLSEDQIKLALKELK